MNNLVHYKSEDQYAIITIANGKANAISHEVIAGIHLALDKALAEDIFCWIRFKSHD